mgnify:CR=1 FL=1
MITDVKAQLNNYKVFIPCAGTGSRLHEKTKNLNKALISVGNKPVISHIVEKFDDKVDIIIALGYKGDYIKQFLEITYPKKNFQFVEVDVFEGEGSGLGYTLNYCKKYLQSKFIFISNDTIILDEIPSMSKRNWKNWIGYSDKFVNKNYRSIKLNQDGKIDSLLEKNDNSKFSYIGMCGIHDYENFWSYMDDSSILKDINLQNKIDTGEIEPSALPILTGESYGLQRMLDSGIEFDAIKFDWYDAGDKDVLSEAQKFLEPENTPNILNKSDEAIWFVNHNVVKFHVDEKFIKNRVKRADLLKDYCPKIIDYKKNMYAYKFVKGNTLSNNVTTENFKFFLDYLKEFHTPYPKTKKFLSNCMKFYKEKTNNRVKEYFIRFGLQDNGREVINGQKTNSIHNLLEKLNWNWISDGIPVRFHGDLHFENILVPKNNDFHTPPFLFVDWRQDFNGDLSIGDIYYDFAKIYHGLIISHELINKNLFSFRRNMNEINYDFLIKNINLDCQEIFIEWLDKEGYDSKKVRIMSALIFLNIAGLHHNPYSHLLFNLGKKMIGDV